MNNHYEMKIANLKKERDELFKTCLDNKNIIQGLETEIRKKDFNLNMAVETMNTAIKNIEALNEKNNN